MKPLTGFRLRFSLKNQSTETRVVKMCDLIRACLLIKLKSTPSGPGGKLLGRTPSASLTWEAGEGFPTRDSPVRWQRGAPDSGSFRWRVGDPDAEPVQH